MRITVKSLLLTALLAGPCLAGDDPTQAFIERQSFVQTVALSEVGTLLDQPEVLEPYLDFDWSEEVINHQAIEREGDKLTIRFAERAPLVLKDIIVEATDEAEGDEQRYDYLLSTEKYHLLAVHFQHDQPGFLLVEQSGDGTYFINTHE